MNSVSTKPGDQYGEWTLITPLTDGSLWLAKCSCGSQKTVLLELLISKASKACHSCTTGTYKSWYEMCSRCENSADKNYHQYGGRGIEICTEWHDFKNFLSDMGLQPKGMTLDRTNPDGNYTSENCRWATRKQQANNMSGQARYTVNGIEGTAAEICAALGLKYNTVAKRLRHGWKAEDAFQPGNFSGQIKTTERANYSHWKSEC